MTVIVVLAGVALIGWLLARRVRVFRQRREERARVDALAWDAAKSIDRATERATAALLLAVKVARWHEENER